MENKALAAAVMVSLVLLGFGTPADSLIVNTTLTQCSTTCESKNCADPFTLRYGKYCGLGYTGCAGQAACDGMDSCCLTHDNCIGSNLQNYVNRTCNDALKDCVEQFKDANLPQFAGSNCSATEVEAVIIASMDVASQVGNNACKPQRNLHWIEALVSILSLVLVFGW